MGKFENKIAVVTGAGGTLCSEIAISLAAEGAKVYLVGRTADKLQKVADKIMGALQNPHLKEQKKAEVKEHARKSVRALLEANKRLVEEQRANVTEAPAQKKSRGEELG